MTLSTSLGTNGKVSKCVKQKCSNTFSSIDQLYLSPDCYETRLKAGVLFEDELCKCFINHFYFIHF